MCDCFSHVSCWGPGPQPGMCPHGEWNQRPFGLQARTQSTEAQQPGLFISIFKIVFTTILMLTSTVVILKCYFSLFLMVRNIFDTFFYDYFPFYWKLFLIVWGPYRKGSFNLCPVVASTF